VVAAEVTLHRQEIARARIFRIDRGGALEGIDGCLWHRVALACHDSRLAESGPGEGIIRIEGNRFLIGAGRFGKAALPEIGESQIPPGLHILRICSRALLQARNVLPARIGCHGRRIAILIARDCEAHGKGRCKRCGDKRDPSR
jgi:hypothetical protein